MENRAAKKNDMLIMSEVRESSLAFYAWGTRCNSLSAALSLSLPHSDVTSSVSFFYLSLFSFFIRLPHPPCTGPCGTEAPKQQCKSRRNELLVYTLNLGWQGGQEI